MPLRRLVLRKQMYVATASSTDQDRACNIGISVDNSATSDEKSDMSDGDASMSCETGSDDDGIDSYRFNDDNHAHETALLVEDNGEWRKVDVYKHADREVADGVVLWFGADEYEGLGCTYSYRNRTIYDNDGERLPTKSLD